MASATKRTARRADALSKERIVEASIDILDTGGERALTFRVLATELSTGAGAIYWHVADKNELLAAATGHIISRAVTAVDGDAEPRDAIRSLAHAVFDALDAHPWVGAQLSREPWQPAIVQIFEGIGSRLQPLGVPETAQFNAASALVNYFLGLAGQYAAAARLISSATDRTAFLGGIAARWESLDPVEYPFVRQMAVTLAEHDDREQFLAGIDLILAGIETLRTSI